MTNPKVIAKKYPFLQKTVDVFFDVPFSILYDKLDRDKTIFVTDRNVFSNHSEKFEGYKTIVLESGEGIKNQQTVDDVIRQMIEMEADRNSFLVGVGGGVVTDITGYAASVYMRGIQFAFVPTSILAMVDASIGGKNGVDVGSYKNLVGTINQPEFLCYDFSLLQTLPNEEWVSGFAEIIKHACIKDASLFSFLEEKSIQEFQKDSSLVAKLVEDNVNIKYNVVANDENETGERKLLNFGHTIGHAIEKISGLLHGHAISVGMVEACMVSQKINRFSEEETNRVTRLLSKYQLPISWPYDKAKAWEVLLHDKKRAGENMNFVVLNKIGQGGVKKIPIIELKELFFEGL